MSNKPAEQHVLEARMHSIAEKCGMETPLHYKIGVYLRQLGPHQREREGSQLLIKAQAALASVQTEIAHNSHCMELLTERMLDAEAELTEVNAQRDEISFQISRLESDLSHDAESFGSGSV